MKSGEYVRLSVFGVVIGLGLSVVIDHIDRTLGRIFDKVRLHAQAASSTDPPADLADGSSSVVRCNAVQTGSAPIDTKSKASVLAHIACAQFASSDEMGALKTVERIGDRDIQDHVRGHLLLLEINRIDEWSLMGVQVISTPPGINDSTEARSPSSSKGVSTLSVADHNSTNASSIASKEQQDLEQRKKSARAAAIKILADAPNFIEAMIDPGSRAVAWCAVAQARASKLGDNEGARHAFRRAVNEADRIVDDPSLAAAKLVTSNSDAAPAADSFWWLALKLASIGGFFGLAKWLLDKLFAPTVTRAGQAIANHPQVERVGKQISRAFGTQSVTPNGVAEKPDVVAADTSATNAHIERPDATRAF